LALQIALIFSIHLVENQEKWSASGITYGIPKHLSSDNDPLFLYHRWQANLWILDIDEIKTVPYTPRSHPSVERLIGTIRREYLDHTFFWNPQDLERKIDTFRHYYNQYRVHQSLD
jgi:transposase InsO family protein